MRIQRLPALAAVLTAPLVALAAPVAAEAKLVYGCGPNLCTADDDGSGSKPLTSDAQAEGNQFFFGPDLSADGKKVAFYRQGTGAGAYVIDLATNTRTKLPTGGTPFDVALSPNGSRVAVNEFGGGESAPSKFCYYNSDGSGQACDPPQNIGGYGNAYKPDGRIIAAFNHPSPAPGQKTGLLRLCLRFAEGSGQAGCEKELVADPAHNFTYYNDVSPDGKLIVTTWDDEQRGKGALALYDAETGAFIRQLTNGPDRSPSFTADGKSIVFGRNPLQPDEAVFSIPVNGNPGDEKKIIEGGRDPSAGAPATVAGPAVSGLKAKSAQKGASVKGTAAVGAEGSTLTAELRGPGGSLGKLTKRSVAAGIAKFTVKLNAKGKKALAARGKLKLTLLVSVKAPDGEKASVKKKVTLSR